MRQKVKILLLCTGIAVTALAAVLTVFFSRDEDTLEKLINNCVEKIGEEYIEARNKIIQDPESVEELSNFKASTWQEEWIKKICLGWLEHNERYSLDYNIFNMDEILIRYKKHGGPRIPTGWARSRATGSKNKESIPFVVEYLWKVGPDLFGPKSWRQKTCLKYLLLTADAAVLPTIIEILEHEPPTISGKEKIRQYTDLGLDSEAIEVANKVEASIVPLKIELVVKFGNKDTINMLKAKIEDRKKSGLSTKHLEEAFKKLQERLKKEEQEAGQKPKQQWESNQQKTVPNGNEENEAEESSLKPVHVEKSKPEIEPVVETTQPGKKWFVICLTVLGLVVVGFVLFLLLRRRRGPGGQ